MAGILRGDIFWANLNPVKEREQAGFRPVLILSHEIFNERSGTVIAVAITGQPRQKDVNIRFRRDYLCVRWLKVTFQCLEGMEWHHRKPEEKAQEN